MERSPGSPRPSTTKGEEEKKKGDAPEPEKGVEETPETGTKEEPKALLEVGSETVPGAAQEMPPGPHVEAPGPSVPRESLRSVRRKLWEVEPSKVKRSLEMTTEEKAELEEKKTRWGYDFEKDRPIPGGAYVWEEVRDAPKFYKEKRTGKKTKPSKATAKRKKEEEEEKEDEPKKKKKKEEEKK